jgi:hypothetical protein
MALLKGMMLHSIHMHENINRNQTNLYLLNEFLNQNPSQILKKKVLASKNCKHSYVFFDLFLTTFFLEVLSFARITLILTTLVLTQILGD